MLRVLHVDGDQVLQLRPRVDRADFPPQDFVQDPRQRPGDRREQGHEEVDDVNHPGSEEQAVPTTDGLRRDLGEHQDQDRRADEAVDASGERSYQNR